MEEGSTDASQAGPDPADAAAAIILGEREGGRGRASEGEPEREYVEGPLLEQRPRDPAAGEPLDNRGEASLVFDLLLLLLLFPVLLTLPAVAVAAPVAGVVKIDAEGEDGDVDVDVDMTTLGTGAVEKEGKPVAESEAKSTVGPRLRGSRGESGPRGAAGEEEEEEEEEETGTGGDC